MNEETRRIMWVAAAAIVAAEFLLAVFNEHRRLHRWLREYETSMTERRDEIRSRWMAAEGLTDAKD